MRKVVYSVSGRKDGGSWKQYVFCCSTRGENVCKNCVWNGNEFPVTTQQNARSVHGCEQACVGDPMTYWDPSGRNHKAGTNRDFL